MLPAIRRVESQKLYAKFGGPLLLAVSIFYLTFHSLAGERGVYALLKEERKLEILTADLKQTEAERKDIEHRVRLLSSGSLDLDLLDEQSRSILGVSGESELVIPMHTEETSGPHAN